MLFKRGKVYITNTMTGIEKPELHGSNALDWVTFTVDDTKVVMAADTIVRLYAIIEHECLRKNLTVEEYMTLVKENTCEK